MHLYPCDAVLLTCVVLLFKPGLLNLPSAQQVYTREQIVRP